MNDKPIKECYNKIISEVITGLREDNDLAGLIPDINNVINMLEEVVSIDSRSGMNI